MRVASDHPCRGDAGGWIHRLTEQAGSPRPFAFHLPVRVPTADFATLAAQWSRNLTNERLDAFASTLGVTVSSLRALGVGWTGRGSYSFPMHDAQRRVVGIRLRDARTGRKFAVTGSREGVFLADRRQDDPLLVVEGPTDAAAALVLGFDAMGRPSCTGAVGITATLAHRREVVIVADADAPGRRGAEALASTLLPVVTSLRVIEPPPPHKDLREWLLQGLTREQLHARIDAQPPRQLQVRIEVRQ